MVNNSLKVKDFIYLNVEIMYSLYSQVFEGLTDQLVRSYIDEMSSRDSQKSNPIFGKKIETQVAMASLMTENKILHDHMYNLLEDKLNNFLIRNSDFSIDNYLDNIKTSSFIKIKGNAEIEDYDRIKILFEKYNEIGEAIAYSSVAEIKENLEENEKEVKKIKDKNERARALAQLKPLKNKLANFAKDHGLQLDQKLLTNLSMFSELFGSGRYDVTIPSEASDNLVFRGILEKRWLRIDTSYLRALYGGVSASDWTMVGQVTYIPASSSSEESNIEYNSNNREEPFNYGEDKIPEENELDDTNEKVSMRDPFRTVFRSVGEFENIFLESQERFEIILNPIAIYRESVFS